MEPINFFERIKYLFNIIFTSPFFIFLLVVLIFTLILLIINVKSNNKKVKLITAITYIVTMIVIFTYYISTILSLGDTIVDKIFTGIYFPNYISYICMIIISILLIFVVLFDKNSTRFGKYGSILSFSFIMFLFILSLETIISNKIDITSKLQIYSNDTLVILIQATTIIFVIWMIIYVINLIVKKLDQKINEPLPKKNKINPNIFKKLRVENDIYVEEPKLMDDESFFEALKRFKEKMKNK